METTQEDLARKLSVWYDYALRQGWNDAVSRLPRSLREKIKCPTISLCAELGKWGCWIGGKEQRIELNYRLLTDFQWPILLEVMKHEVAHQVCEYLGYAVGESAHGPKFREICDVLGANPQASVLDPSTWKTTEANGEMGETAKMMERLKKVLAMTQSTNQNEAEVALAKAQEIAERYALDLKNLSGEEEFEVLCLGKVEARKNIVERTLSSLLQKHFNVRAVWHWAPVLGDNRTMGSVLMIIGTVQNLQIASYTYDYIKHYLETAWEKFMVERYTKKKQAMYGFFTEPGRSEGRSTDKRDFCLGVLEGLEQSLTARKNAETLPQDKAVILAEQNERLEDFFNWKLNHVVKRASRGIHVNRSLHERGQEIGRDLSINPGVGKGTGPRLLNG